MDSLERLRARFDTLSDLQSLVGTMKALAGVGVHRLDDAARSVAQYYRTIELGLQVALRATPDEPAQAPAQRGARAAIVFGSDHGLCGRFNEDLIEFAEERLAALVRDSRAPHVLAVGARAASLLERRGYRPEGEFVVPGTPEAATPSVRKILVSVERWREAGVREVVMVHQRPRPDGRCHPVLVQLLPVAPRRFRRIGGARWASRSLPIFTMDRAELLAALLRQYFFVSVLRALIESIAAENASRLAAMQAAERSLDERSDTLLAELQHVRQTAITSELLDIVSGYEALGGTAESGTS